MLSALKLTVYHRSFYDWKLVKASDVRPGDVAVASHLGQEFAHLQVQYNEPNTTDVVISEAALDQWVADHEEGVMNARKGYTTNHVGGPLDGQEVVVAPRNLPLKSREELLAQHLADAVFPFHFPSEHVTKIKVSDVEDADAGKKLERFLNRRFVIEDESAAEKSKAPK